MRMASILLFVFTCSLFAGDAVQIGTSNSPLATAHNNSRKIARTYDDRRVVVYEDKEDSYDVVKLTYSDDGVNWTTPSLLAYGYAPTIAISATDTFYVAWFARDSNWPRIIMFHAKDVPSSPVNAAPKSGHIASRDNQTVCLAVDNNYVHQVSHYITQDSSISYIDYNILNKQLHPLGVGGTLNNPRDGDVGYPTLSCDLEYQPGPAHIVWSEQDDTGSRLKYVGIYPDIFYESEWQLDVRDYLSMGFLHTLDNSNGLSSPSISTRNSLLIPNLSMLIGAFHNSDMNGMTIKTWNVLRDDQAPIFLENGNEYHMPDIGQALPSADDTIHPQRSCAIVWQNDGHIFYGQTSEATIKTEPAIHINTNSNSSARYPSVCYKTFRPDKFDVVWTEGTSAPHKIMYRRMKKDYTNILSKMDILTAELPTGVIGHEYEAKVKVNYQESWHGNDWSVIEGKLPTGLYMAHYQDPPTTNGNLTIMGAPEEAGDFTFTLSVQHPIFPREDYISLADTAEFTIHVKTKVGAQSENDTAPDAFQLWPVFPNPFNPSTRIQFSVPKTSNIDISIFDISGSFIQQLENSEYDIGNFYIMWNASHLPSGTYLIHMQADDFSAMQKCLLLK